MALKVSDDKHGQVESCPTLTDSLGQFGAGGLL